MGARAPRLILGSPARAARIFLLSPADSSGKRARFLEESEADLAQRLRARGGAPIGEIFSFVSSLYFRGKLAYARAFARPPRGLDGIHVITPCDGLVPPERPIRVGDLRRFAGVPIDVDETRYRRPFLRDLEALAATSAKAEVVLLGSIASPKYVDLLTSVLGSRLLFPVAFVGRGDMSRGGLMLRCVAQAEELEYARVEGAVRRGSRPARLPPLG